MASLVSSAQEWSRSLRLGALASAVAGLPISHARPHGEVLVEELARAGVSPEDDTALFRLPTPILGLLGEERIRTYIPALAHLPATARAVRSKLRRCGRGGMDVAAAARRWVFRALDTSATARALARLGGELFPREIPGAAPWGELPYDERHKVQSALENLRASRDDVGGAMREICVLRALLSDRRGWTEIEYLLRARFFAWPLVVGVSRIGCREERFPLFLPIAVMRSDDPGLPGGLEIKSALTVIQDDDRTLRRALLVAHQHATSIQIAGRFGQGFVLPGITVDLRFSDDVLRSLSVDDLQVEISLASAEAFLFVCFVRRLLIDNRPEHRAIAAEIGRSIWNREGDVNYRLGPVGSIDYKAEAAETWGLFETMLTSPGQVESASPHTGLPIDSAHSTRSLLEAVIPDWTRRDHYIRCPDVESLIRSDGTREEADPVEVAEVERVIRKYGIVKGANSLRFRTHSTSAVLTALHRLRPHGHRMLCVRPIEEEVDERLWWTLLGACGMEAPQFEKLALIATTNRIADAIAKALDLGEDRPAHEAARIPDTIVVLRAGRLFPDDPEPYARVRPFFAPRLVNALRSRLGPSMGFPRLIFVDRDDWIRRRVDPATNGTQEPCVSWAERGILSALGFGFTADSYLRTAARAGALPTSSRRSVKSRLSLLADAGMLGRLDDRFFVERVRLEAWQQQLVESDPLFLARCLFATVPSLTARKRRTGIRVSDLQYRLEPWSVHDVSASLKRARSLAWSEVRAAESGSREARDAQAIRGEIENALDDHVANVEIRTWGRLRLAVKVGGLRDRVLEFASDMVDAIAPVREHVRPPSLSLLAEAYEEVSRWERQPAEDLEASRGRPEHAHMMELLRVAWRFHLEALANLRRADYDNTAEWVSSATRAWAFTQRHWLHLSQEPGFHGLWWKQIRGLPQLLERQLKQNAGQNLEAIASPDYWLLRGDSIEDDRAAIPYYEIGVRLKPKLYPFVRRLLGAVWGAGRTKEAWRVRREHEAGLLQNTSRAQALRRDLRARLGPEWATRSAVRRMRSAHRALSLLGLEGHPSEPKAPAV